MAFRVEISPRAFKDLDEIARHIKRQSGFEQAQEWFNGILAAIRTLEEMPRRCPVADVSKALGQEVRLLLYGKRNREYKVYYSIRQRTPSTGKVQVFHVRHWARKNLNPDQLRELMGNRPAHSALDDAR
jgi:plasmid stabilization system protein ParE